MLLSVPPGTELDEATAAAAMAMVKHLGEAELKIAASYSSPLVWVLNCDGVPTLKGGSVFFLDTGKAVFAVTAAHVVIDYFKDLLAQPVTATIAVHGKTPIPVRIEECYIDGNKEIDIFTFRVTPEQIAYSGKTVLKGHPSEWPPQLPQVNGPITYCGYPGTGRRALSPRDRSFGIGSMCGLVTNVHESCISVLVERENLMQVLGDEPMPENFDFGGMSGGPAITIMQGLIWRSWRPAGVVIEGPNPGDNDDQESIPGLEIVRVRPIHFIKDDGYLDLDRWEQSNFK